MYTTKQQKPQQSRVIVSAHSPLQQRPFVTQRVTFTYDDYNTGVLGNKDGKVFFTEYKGQELYSSGFSGCIMAAFKFLRDNHIPNIDFENIIQIDKDKEYIAHVFCSSTKDLDTKYEFAKLEKDGIIRIEAMYKPYVYKRDRDDIQSIYGVTSNYNLNCLTGSMFKSNYNGGWIGNTYYQDKDGQVKQIKNYFDNNMILNETYYLKGFLGILLQEKEYSDLKSAKSKMDAYLDGIKRYKETHPNIPFPTYIEQDLN